MSKGSILIVEDEAIVAADLAGMLRRRGYEICGTTPRGEEATSLAREGRPDLVLMDIRLAGAMDGVEAAAIIRRELDLPVIFLTAHSDQATLERAKLSEPFGYLLKPFEELGLESHIEMALYKHRAERKLRQAHDELELRVEERTRELREAEQVLKESNETLERRVAERTAELQAANTKLLDSRRAALNMMEDALAARQQAEAASAELRNEVTERKLAEEKLRAQSRTLKAINSGIHALLHAPDELSLLQAACKTVAEDCGHAMVWIGYAEEDEEKRVRPVASAGFEDGYLETLEISWADTERGCGPTGTAIRSGKPCGCSDILSDPAFAPWRDEAIKRGYASSLVLPLMNDGKAFGALSIYSPKPNDFSTEEMDLLMQLTDELAYGIRTVRLRVAHDQSEEELRTTYQHIDLLAETASRLLAAESPQQVVDSLCREVLTAINSDTFFNFLVDEKEERLHLNACAGIPEEEIKKIEWLDYGIAVCGCAARDACRIVAEDISNTPDPRTELVKSYGIQAYACHPLMAQGRVLGTLSFGTRSRPSFSDDDLALMKAVADLVAIAMERKRVEEELRHAKETAEAGTRAKSQFLANMSHELRTPMTGVLGILDLALAGNLDAEQREHIAMAQSSAHSLVRILNDILDLTKIEMGKLSLEEKPFSLRKCLESTFNLFLPVAKSKGLDLCLSVADDVPKTLSGDQTRLSQILTNLIGNAVKFTPKGEVEIRVTAGDRVPDGKQDVIFTVTDTGIGIPDDKKDLLFQVFSQVDTSHSREFGGTGLGLAISKEIVERMGGRITFTSGAGKGSSFCCTIPIGVVETERMTGRAAGKMTPAGDNPQDEETRKAHILIAEDDLIISQILKAMLQRSNYILDFAKNGQKAVELWESGTYDLILMDVQMPRLNGFEATAVIRDKERACGGHIPIIAMTAHALKEDAERCLAAGMDAYISKPIDFKATHQLIEDTLKQKSGGAA